MRLTKPNPITGLLTWELPVYDGCCLIFFVIIFRYYIGDLVTAIYVADTWLPLFDRLIIYIKNYREW